jgi:hypothetical protein
MHPNCYLQKRQTTLEASAQNALNRMKVLNNFTNPDEVESYLTEMRMLKPLILTLHQELLELNEQERVKLVFTLHISLFRL